MRSATPFFESADKSADAQSKSAYRKASQSTAKKNQLCIDNTNFFTSKQRKAPQRKIKVIVVGKDEVGSSNLPSSSKTACTLSGAGCFASTASTKDIVLVLLAVFTLFVLHTDSVGLVGDGKEEIPQNDKPCADFASVVSVHLLSSIIWWIRE